MLLKVKKIDKFAIFCEYSHLNGPQYTDLPVPCNYIFLKCIYLRISKNKCVSCFYGISLWS